VEGLREQLTLAVGAAQAGALLAGLPAACVGPTTAAAARAAGMQVVVTPQVYSAEALVEALKTWRTR